MNRVTATAFSLRLPKESESGFASYRSRRYDITGIARFDGQRLVLEWSGRVHVWESGVASSRSSEEPVPLGTCILPLAEISSVELRGGWWRPRLVVTATTLASLAEVPGARTGRVVLWLSRQDRARARELRSELHYATAEAALHAAERMAELPPQRMPPTHGPAD